jgi:hypothetical protein
MRALSPGVPLRRDLTEHQPRNGKVRTGSADRLTAGTPPGVVEPYEPPAMFPIRAQKMTRGNRTFGGITCDSTATALSVSTKLTADTLLRRITY